MATRIDGPNDDEMDEMRELREARAEQARRATCYPDLLAALEHARIAIDVTRRYVSHAGQYLSLELIQQIEAVIAKASPQAR